MNEQGQKGIDQAKQQIIKQNITAKDLQKYLDNKKKNIEFTVISHDEGTYTLIAEHHQFEM